MNSSPLSSPRWTVVLPGLALVLMAAVVVRTSRAAVTLVNDDRQLHVEAYGESLFAGDQYQMTYFPSDTSDEPFADFGAADSQSVTGAQSAIASTSGSINSPALAPSHFSGSGQASGSAAILDENGSSAFAMAAARLQIGFSVDTTTPFLVLAELAATGTGKAFVELREGLTPGGAQLLLKTNGDGPTVHRVVTLAPGNYTVTFDANFISPVFTAETLAGSASFTGSFSELSAVPEPAAAVAVLGSVALGLCGLKLARRS